jgi:hypothetical protein
MKNYQTIKKVFFTLLLTVALFSFQSSEAQVYARLEMENPSGGTNYPGGWQRQEWSGYDYYMRFYSNSACTVPLTLTSDVHCGVSWIAYYDEALNYGGTFSSEANEGTGQTEIYLGFILTYDLWYDDDNVAWGLQNAFLGGFADGVTYLGTKQI